MGHLKVFEFLGDNTKHVWKLSLLLDRLHVSSIQSFQCLYCEPS